MDNALITKYDRALELAAMSLAADDTLDTGDFIMNTYARAVRIAAILNEPAILDAIKYVNHANKKNGYVIGLEGGDGELHFEVVWDDGDKVSSETIQQFLDAKAEDDIKETQDEDSEEEKEEYIETDEAGNDDEEDGQTSPEDTEETVLSQEEEVSLPAFEIEHLTVAEANTLMGQDVRRFAAENELPSSKLCEISIGIDGVYSLDCLYSKQQGRIVNIALI